MQDLARRLMLQGRRTASILPAAIFGTIGDLSSTLEINKPRLRIGFWPFRSSTNPEAALGLAAALAFALERYRDVRVYRLFARVEGDLENYQWDISQSQFDVDDWQLDDLDENIAIWGSLEQSDGSWKLDINIENDLLEEDDSLKTFTYEASLLSGLISRLIQIAEDIAGFIEPGEVKIVAPVYEDGTWDETNLKALLERAFDWELKLFLSIWGKPWMDSIEADKNALIRAGQEVGQFGAWLVSRLVARALVVADEEASDTLVAYVDDLVDAFPDSLLPPIFLGSALYESGRVQEAYELLEAAIQEREDDADLYLTLGEIYRLGGRPGDAMSIFQEAIQSGKATPIIYVRYADLVLAMDTNNLLMEDFVMIDADRIRADRMTHEAIEAYQAALDAQPDNLEALYRQLMQFLELGRADRRFWPGFERIVQIDKTGERVRGLVDAFYNLDDVTPAFKILKEAVARNPERADLPLNLAVAYLAAEQTDAAITHLNRARGLTDDPLILADIERLMLAAEDPDFETRLGEITDVVSAGNALSTEDVEFLEEAVERAPSFAEGYLLLAKAYIAWDEPATAIETLLDGHKRLPDDPEIAALLAQTLWEAGERASAFGYLNKGLGSNPNHVPLLALTGRYLFEDGQDDAAKAYLARAELIAPNDPVLTQVRIAISRMID